MDFSLQKRGRKRKQEARDDGMPFAYQRHWARALNGDVDVDSILYSGPERWFFTCSSCKHFRYMTSEGLERSVKNGDVSCLICEPPSCVSEVERTVLQTMTQNFGEEVFVPRCKPLFGFAGEVDFCFPLRRVIIQVDGPLHFEESGYPEGTLERQQHADEACNAACMDQGWYLLRLHHHDVLYYANLWIQRILDHSKTSLDNKAKGASHAQACVIFSRSWGRENMFRYR